MIISSLLNLSMYPGLLASVTSNFGHVFCQFDGIKFEIPSKHDTASNFCFINSNIITGNYGLNKTILILVVAFLLSFRIYVNNQICRVPNKTQ